MKRERERMFFVVIKEFYLNFLDFLNDKKMASYIPKNELKKLHITIMKRGVSLLPSFFLLLLTLLFPLFSSFSHQNVFKTRRNSLNLHCNNKDVEKETWLTHFFNKIANKKQETVGKFPFFASTSSSSSSSSSASTKLPPRTREIRKDNLFERFALFLLSFALSKISPDINSASKKVGFNYSNFVGVTKTLLNKNRNAIDISTDVLNLLKFLLPIQLRSAFKKKALNDPKYISEASSLWMSYGFISWLVGPTERFLLVPSSSLPSPLSSSSSMAAAPSISTSSSSTTTISNDTTWHSGVKLLECRYLRESGCKAACLHLCKTPTQSLFQDELGIPLYMKPNFEDCSCEMFFGVKAMPMEEDPVYGTPCFSDCAMNKVFSKQSSLSSSSKNRREQSTSSNKNNIEKCS